ncbi:MAG: hypothetical protein GYA55_01315 [SAR324 cluster bacterium]|uniref:DUF5658 domain-containing protein n=1 Tax=SAR324 cluster bacterium TaxID=2024889 RepID=A0A7X9IKB1_9DELT|nr:hypothetical protein [SAR324 cluster bacterium]
MGIFGSKIKIEVVEDEAEGISYRGEKRRRRTVLLRVGRHSISKRAFQLGLFLALFQIFDGILTYVGLTLFGLEMEGNAFLNMLMEAFGSFPVIFVSKLIALILVGGLTLYAHPRPWFRPVIVILILTYLVLAVLPWTFIISGQH